jgi:NADH-quinone oxidoreductase subunit L
MPALPTFDALYRRAFIVPTRYLTALTDWLDRAVWDGLVHVTARGYLVLGNVISWVDRALIDGLIRVLTGAASTLGAAFRTVQTGRVQGYVAAAVAALIGLLLLW